MHKPFLFFLTASLALAAASLHADITLAPFFRDNAVLQRGKPVPVWGRAAPGEAVTVSFAGQTHTVTADTSGNWRVVLDPMPASAEPRDMSITARSDNSASRIPHSAFKLSNLLVGDVWLCSGQSNMARQVKASLNAPAEIASANFPLIRHFKTIASSSDTPLEGARGEWQAASPETVAEFTAVGYYFARELYKNLNIPIGLLNSSLGGSPIESWTSRETLAADRAWPDIQTRWAKAQKDAVAEQAAYQAELQKWEQARAEAKAARKPFRTRMPKNPDGPLNRDRPSGLYNAMIAPFAPSAICGVLWYQGEANTGRPAEYKRLFPAMITQWRAAFAQGDIPFYYVQLANHRSGAQNKAFLREAQQGALALPNTGQAVTIDIGESDDIHPKNKQDAGLRLALNALAKTYGRPVEYSGPAFAGVTKENDTLRIRFTHAAGLMTKDPKMPGFIIAGPDKRFVPAEARIEGETIVVCAKNMKEPAAVRYAWASDPPSPLYNGANLPAPPFRSDDWSEY